MESKKSIGKHSIRNNSDRIGKSDRIGSLDLSFKRVRGRREFMDLVLEFVREKKEISLITLEGYFQYTTGASSTSIKQALAVLESLNLILIEEILQPHYQQIIKIIDNQNGK